LFWIDTPFFLRSSTWIAASASNSRKEYVLQILVRDNNVDQAMKVLKKKMQREGVFRELKRQRFYEKPSERKAREKGEAIRRTRKLARKRAQREGLLPAPKPKLRAGPARPPRF
jgi:small subunit ribosomal protein S21